MIKYSERNYKNKKSNYNSYVMNQVNQLSHIENEDSLNIKNSDILLSKLEKSALSSAGSQGHLVAASLKRWGRRRDIRDPARGVRTVWRSRVFGHFATPDPYRRSLPNNLIKLINMKSFILIMIF